MSIEGVNIDNNFHGPQFCEPIAPEAYEYWRVSEETRRPSMDFMEEIQGAVNRKMRAKLIDWLVEVAEEYVLPPDTLFLAVNYMDRYLSGNAINRRQLKLLGVACMMIAAKYEDFYGPMAADFCYITNYKYSTEQVLQMESSVLNFFEFKMKVPTTICFMRCFLIVAKQTCKVSWNELEYIANYLAELSLLEYRLLRYTPSLIAASATFLAKLILLPREKPWNSTLRYYSRYQASELRECVKTLHWLYRGGSKIIRAKAIRKKYREHKVVAKKGCPPSIAPEFFEN